MNLYLDTEFNGHGGELISLAIASETGANWYGVCWPDAEIHPWVKEHVIPLVGAMASNVETSNRKMFRESLRGFLGAYENPTIYADWPDDFVHLMRAMSGDSFDESWMIPCSMSLITTPPGQPTPAIPHNALSDAIALMEWHRESGSKNLIR
jgi:hypothetical protein